MPKPVIVPLRGARSPSSANHARLSREASGDRQLQLELAAAYLQFGDVQGKPYAPNLGDSANAPLSYARAVEIATPLAATEHGGTSTARRVLG